MEAASGDVEIKPSPVVDLTRGEEVSFYMHSKVDPLNPNYGNWNLPPIPGHTCSLYIEATTDTKWNTLDSCDEFEEESRWV